MLIQMLQVTSSCLHGIPDDLNAVTPGQHVQAQTITTYHNEALTYYRFISYIIIKYLSN